MNTKTRDARRRARNYTRAVASYRRHQRQMAELAADILANDPVLGPIFQMFPIAYAATKVLGMIGSRGLL